MVEISPIEVKRRLGRGVLRPGKDHQGQRSNPTEFAVVEKEKKQKTPTGLEKQLLFLANPKAVRAYREAGFSDDQIFDILNQ